MHTDTPASIALKELSIFEFNSEAKAISMLNQLPASVRVVDLFSLTNGNFVCLLSAQNMKSVHTATKKLHRKYIKSEAYLPELHREFLPALYFLNKPEVCESLLIVEPKTFSNLAEAVQLAYENNCSVLDLKSQKVFSKNLIYITGSFDNASGLQKKFVRKKFKSDFLKKISPSLFVFLGIIKPG